MSWYVLTRNFSTGQQRYSSRSSCIIRQICQTLSRRHVCLHFFLILPPSFTIGSPFFFFFLFCQPVGSSLDAWCDLCWTEEKLRGGKMSMDSAWGLGAFDSFNRALWLPQQGVRQSMAGSEVRTASIKAYVRSPRAVGSGWSLGGFGE